MFRLLAVLVALLCAAGVQSTAISQLRDFSAYSDQVNAPLDVSRCANVKIVETSEGILRSPFYFRKQAKSVDINKTTSLKCKWTLVAPTDHAFEITLVDYERDPTGSCAESGRFDIKNLVFNEDANKSNASSAVDQSSKHSLLMPFYDADNENKLNKRLHHFNKNVLSSCSFAFQPFTVLRSTSNVVQIEYEAKTTGDYDATLNFFLTFNVVRANESEEVSGSQEPFCSQPEEIKCGIDYNNLSGEKQPTGQSMRHYSCIHKDVLCNCLDAATALSTNATPATSGILYDNCDYLMKRYQGYLDFLIKRPADYCHFYLNLNRKCRKNDETDKSFYPNAVDGTYPHPDQAASSIVDPDSDQLMDDYEASGDDDEPRPNYLADDGPLVRESPLSDDPAGGDNATAVSRAAQEACQNVIKTGDFGWIASPNFNLASVFGNKYPDNLTCAYHITVRNGSTIQIRFKYYYLNPIFISIPASQAPPPAAPARPEPLATKERRSLKTFPSSYVNYIYKQLQQPYISDSSKKFQLLAERSIDYDYINIYDGTSASDPLLAHLTASQNDYMARNINAKVFNSRSNSLYVVFHSQQATAANKQQAKYTSPVLGFNMTYQVRGGCIEDQLSCNSPYEAECYSKSQRCNDVWDCHNGEDERGCGPCPIDQYWCRNHIFCYRQQDRCDGDHQCIDKSDEMNCDSWFCNSANGTFLCKNGRCIYEQWVCDGQNDCDDGSDEDKCPTPLTRRVITTAVVGGTLCCLLLVMALGCACKLYTLHTVGYRTNVRLSQTVQSAAAAAAAAPLLPRSSTATTVIDTGVAEPSIAVGQGNSGFLASLLRRPDAAVGESGVPTVHHSLPQSASFPATLGVPPTLPPPPPTTIATGAGELPLPHHLIAPPTYNQTMGLVDEYEQRQLAFIEHVRSILTQQQQQNSAAAASGSGQPNAATIPLVTSSSTTLHRVTSNTGYRRSHSSRHHRHHHHHHGGHHHSSSSRTAQAGQSGSGGGADSVSGSSASNGSSSGRHASHRHHSQSHSRNYDANRRGLMLSEQNETQQQQSTSAAAAAASAAARRSSNVSATTNAASFSSAISAGQTQLGAQLTFNLNQPVAGGANSVPLMPLTDSSPISAANSSNSAPSSSALNQQVSTFNSLVNKTSNASTNLRDRIAKLIKDIVVHHGDNIQYVQLADQLNQSTTAPSTGGTTPGSAPIARADAAAANGESVSLSSTNSTSSVCLSPELSVDSASGEASSPGSAPTDAPTQPAEPSSSSSSGATSSTSGNNNNTNKPASAESEDDVPLIQA